jgi:hypothetical protein
MRGRVSSTTHHLKPIGLIITLLPHHIPDNTYNDEYQP